MMKGLQMTKYIVKNCPAIKPMITVDGKHGGKTMLRSKAQTTNQKLGVDNDKLIKIFMQNLWD